MRRAAIIAVAVCALAAPAAASATAAPGTPTPGTPPPSSPSPTTAAPMPGSGGFASNGGILGGPGILDQPDVTCKQLVPGTSPLVIKNCASDQQPRSAYPAGNYGLDVHVDTGITSPGSDIADVFQTILGGIFQAMVSVVGAILSILGWAFNFDLFRSGFTTINTAVSRELGGFTLPLLPLAFAILGGFLVIRWLRASEGAMVGHAVLALALGGLGFVIADHPGTVLSPIDNFTNRLSGGTVGLLSGNGRSNGYADSEPALWKTAVEQPWCVLEFGSSALRWCTSPPDAAMRKAAAGIAASHLPQALGDQGTNQQAAQEAPLERVRMNDAQTNGEEFLSFWTNSDARNGKNDPWTLYSALNKEHPDYLTIRGPSGWIPRGIGLLMGSVVGLMFLAIIAYITVQIIVAAFVIVLCLLASPIAIPVAVAGGHRSFNRFVFDWFLPAFARKVVYAGYLGLIIIASTLASAVVAPAGFVVYWFVLGTLYFAALLLRRKPMELLGVSAFPIGEHHFVAKALALGAAAGGGAYEWRKHRHEQGPPTPGETYVHHEDRHETHQHVHVHNGNGYHNDDEAAMAAMRGRESRDTDLRQIDREERDLPAGDEDYNDGETRELEP